MELQSFTLPNGIRLVHSPSAGPVAHCGVFIDAGSRDENDRQHGVAHLIEHTIFKGTVKRSLFQVLNRLENVGADLNAYTTKEETGVHASFLCEHYERTLELFRDILFNSVFPEKEIEKEKRVVLDEIRSYLDTPAEQVFDDFEDLVFHGHPLGRNILGTPKSLKSLVRNDILEFMATRYGLTDIVIASVGRIDFAKLVKLVLKHFSVSPDRSPGAPRIPFTGYTVFENSLKRRNAQVHCVIGSPAYAFSDDRRIPLALLNNLLGGPVMNSRLSMALRERNGLTYHSESNYTAYSDAGIIQIYFGTDPVHYEKALEIVMRELRNLREARLSPVQLHTMQKQLAGQLAIARESNLAVMMAMGKSFLLQDRFDPVESILSRIMDTTAEELLEIANEIFDPGRISRLTFHP